MSAPERPVALTRAARRDLRDIEAYTLRRWDARQWARYEEDLAHALAAIGTNPHLGRTRDDVRPGYRSFPVGQHLIFYRVTATAVIVSRILHGRMDVGLTLRDRS